MARKSELLAPAGNMEAFKAAIANGCDAVYLGMQKFGARAYSDNFDEESLKEAVEYAHLRDVKVYVTMNTVVYEDELTSMEEQVDYLNSIGVDGVIVQDLAVLEYIRDNFKDLEAHCSTQMGIDDLEGTLLMKELGAKRVVLSREVPIEKVKEIRRTSGVPVEIFIHGALCISYSGNCLMSGMTGNRLGNRGRCIGSCRKLYEIIDKTGGEVLGKNYILSTKDLNTLEYVSDFEGIDSLKIEGRMKEPVYVANVVSRYRKALDGEITAEDREKLNHTFNRCFTRGYLFGEDKKDITNIEKPNNYGYKIGRVLGKRSGMYEIGLEKPLGQNDTIRIRRGDEDVNLSVARLYNSRGELVNQSETRAYIKIRENLLPGDEVFKTKDVRYIKELETMLEGEFRRYPVDFSVYACPGAPLVVEASGLGGNCIYESEEILSEALSSPTDRDAVVKQLSRLKDTVLEPGSIIYEEYGAFIPAKMLNAARKFIVGELYSQKINRAKNREKEPCRGIGLKAGHENTSGALSGNECQKAAGNAAVKPYLTAQVLSEEQYRACLEMGLAEDNIYFENVVRRNHNSYEDKAGLLLLGGLGGIYRYKDSNPFVTDYSLNITNSRSCLALQRLGAKRITLSYEMNREGIKNLICGCKKAGSNPALEMIVYGRAPLLFTEYCPLKKMNQCGLCKERSYEIRDEFGSFPLLSSPGCTCTVLNGKVLNLIDEMSDIEGVEAFRLSFTTEKAEEVKRVVSLARAKLEGSLASSAFNSNTDTRGHYSREIL